MTKKKISFSILTKVAGDIEKSTRKIANESKKIVKKPQKSSNKFMEKTAQTVKNNNQNAKKFVKKTVEKASNLALKTKDLKKDDLLKAYNEKVRILANDGTDFGTVRRGIFAKLANFADDDKFDFESEEEKNIVEAYKKYPGFDFELGGKQYKVTYNGYKSIANNTWDKYTPDASEEKAFEAIKRYPIYELTTTDSEGKTKNWGKISYYGMKSIQNGNSYSSEFNEEMQTINDYYNSNKPKSYDEVYNEAINKIIDKAKDNPSVMYEIDPDSANKDLAYYYQFITPSEREKIWQEFDEDLQKSVKTTVERNKYKNLLNQREQDLTNEYSDTKNTKKKNDEISSLVNALTKTEGNFDKGYKISLQVNQIKKILKEGEKINSNYKKIADKSNASDKYVPEKNAEKYIYNLDSKNHNDVYNMINLYHSGKLDKYHAFSVSGNNIKPWMYMNPEEVSVYNKLDANTADKYLEELDDVLRLRMSNDLAEKAKKEGKKHPYMATAASLLGNLTNSGAVALDTFIADVTGNTAGYSDASIALRQAQNLRAGVTEEISERHGKVAAWAYNTAQSILENAIILALTKGAGTAAGMPAKAIERTALLTMATNSASNEMISIADRGGTVRQMTYGGIAAGLFEYLFEKVPVEKILSIKGGSTVKNMIGSAITEIPSEMATEVSNIIADSIIMGEKSENSLRIQQLIKDKGMTAKDAIKQVLLENLDQVLQAGASGGVSGGVMGGGATIINNATYNGEMKPIANDIIENPKAIDRLIKLGKELGVKEAKVVSEAVAKGETLTTKQVRKLTDAVVKKSIEKDARLPNIIKTIATIEGRKSDYYTSQEAIDTARAVYRTVAGTATKTDRTLVARSDGARAIILASANTIGINGEDSKGVTAWATLKSEAKKRMRSVTTPQSALPTAPLTQGSHGVRSDNPSGSTSHLPLHKGGLEVRSEGKSATISDGEISSNGKKVTIDNTSKVAGNVVLDEESYNFRKANKVGYKAIQTMAKDLGMKVKYVDGLTDSEGKALDGVITSEGIFINTQSKNPTRWAATHEFSHRMKQTGGKMWQRYQDYVIKHLKETGKYEERYNLKKGAYAESEIDEEIAADYIGVMFEDVKELSNFIRKNRRDAFGIRNAYYKVLDKLGLLDEKKKAQAMWAKAYREAMKNSDVKYEDGAHESKSGTRVSENSDLKSDDSSGKMKVNNNLSESGERNESKNTKALGTDGTGQNNDSVWERSDDSEKVYKNMGIRTETLGEGERTKLGHIPWSGRIQSYDLNSSREKELSYGILRKISERRIKEKDSLGRTISQQVQDYFADTVLKTEEGALIPLYHATDNTFDVFEYGDFGFHVGSAEQAIYLDKKYIKEVYVNIKNPLFINSDTMRWPGLAIASHALSQNIITLDEFNRLYKLEGFRGFDYNSEANKAIRELLKEKGYDGIIYPNGVEGEGISAIAFDSEQIKYTSNQNPTTNKNLKKSVAGTRVEESSSSEVSESLLEENARLRAELENLHLQLDQAEGKGLDQKAIKKAAENIKKAYFSKIKTSELHQELAKLYRFMASKDATANEISDRINAIAERVIRNAYDIIDNIEYRDLLYMIKNTKIQVPESDKASFADGYEHFRKSNMGKIKLVNDGYPLDALWDDLTTYYPYFFSEDLRGSEERLNRILEIREEFQPIEDAVYKTEEEKQKAITALANDIMESFFNIPEGGDGKYIFYDKRAAQAKKDFKMTEENYIKAVKKVNEKLEKMAEMYEYEINRIEERHEAELDTNYNQFLSDNGGGLHTFRPAKEKGWLSQQWITNRSEGNEEIAKSLNKISDIISNDFGVPINNRSFSDEDVAGSFNLTAEAIHTRAKNDIITLSHEVGHLLDKKLKLQKLDGIDELTANFDRTLAALGYGEKSRKAEAVGEFVRMYLTNKEVAKAFCPEYFEAFESVIEKSDYKKAVEKLSGAVNAYLSAKTSERIDLAISDKTEEKSIRNNLAEKKNKFPELWNKFQYEFVDRYYAIGRAQGKVYAKNPEGKYDAHTLATNSLNSAARSAYILTKSFVTIEGEEIGKSFIDCLEPIANKKAGIRKKNISELNRYLVLKHALEWIDPKTEGAHKKRVFADESLENPEVLKAEIEKIEKDLPEVKEAAENIYQYIRNLKKYWGIDAGLMTQELSDKLDKMYPNYVPFFREGDTKTITGARTNLANQRAPILEASGGEGMIVNPLESIIGLTNKYVKTASRNMAMQAIAHMADNVGGTGFIIERASGEQQSALEGNEILEEKADAPEASPEELRSITTEEDVWTKATKNGKGFASVLIDGEKVWYQINDEQLFSAVADMEPKRLNAFLRGCNVALNVKRSLITSNNPLFAATNAVRDAITAYNNIDINNPFSYLRAYFTALYHVIRKNPNYKRWCAMGGGHSSELSANMDAVKRELGKAMRNPKAKAFSWIIHPIQAIASVNDAIESTPRLMAFEHEMKKSGDVHKAINKADDITTNFKRGGRTAKNLNNMFMFSNAAIQGLDRTIRSFTKNETEHGLRNRIIKYSVVATLATLFQMAINRRDEESKEDYKNLSSYMKRSNYVISIGGGKFLRIPTAREQDMLRVIITDAVNYAFGDKEAFDGLLGFAVDTLWPWYVELPQNTDGKSTLDIMTEMFINTARNTPFGFLTDFAANYDFTGKPIVSSKYDDVPRKEQYDERTSKLAVWLGKLTNESPLKIDYIINSNFGILGTINKSLFPMDKSQKDKSIGFISRWVADSYYSTDVLDKVYSKNEAAKMKFQGDNSGKNLAEYKKTSVAADFITQYNKAVKALPEEEKRTARKRLLDIINNWGNGKSAFEEELIRLYDATGEDLFITAPKLSISTTTGKRDMTADEYVELVEKYTAGYEALFAEVIASEKYKNADDYTKAKLLKDANSYALNSAKAEIFPDFELPKWQAEIFEGKETASEAFSGRVEADAFTSAKKEWREKHFNIDESIHSSEEIKSMLAFEEQASTFYVSHEMGIPYKEENYRAVQVYNDYLSDVMSLEEFASIKAYAQKTAAKIDGKDSLSKDELKMVIDATSYSNDVKAALFEAISRKGTINPYNGYKVGSEQQFVVLTHSPTKDKKSDVVAPKTEPKTENEKTPKDFPERYTDENDFYVIEPQDIEINRGNSSGYEKKNQTTKKQVNYKTQTTKKQVNYKTQTTPPAQTKITVNYDSTKYTPKQVSRFKQVESDANSYYNSPRLSSYKGSKLRHMNVFETRLKSYIDLDTYAKIRAEAFGDADKLDASKLRDYIAGLDYDTEIQAALFEAIGEEEWENPFEEGDSSLPSE